MTPAANILPRSATAFDLVVLDAEGVCGPPASNGASTAHAFNAATRDGHSEWIIFRDVHCTIPAERLHTALTQLRGDAGRMGYVARAQHAADFDLAGFCVSDTLSSEAVVFERALLNEVGGCDETFTASALWELWLRMARHTRPRAIRVPHDNDTHEQSRSEHTVACLAEQLAATLRVHGRTRDLACELPGTMRAQWRERQRLVAAMLARFESDGDDGTVSPALSNALTHVSHAALRLGDLRDVHAANTLIERAQAGGRADEAALRTRLHLLRAMARPEQVILALGQLHDSAHPDVLRELGHALRALGQLDDAVAIDGITAGLPGALPSVPDDDEAIPGISPGRPTEPRWPAWLSRGTAHAATWASAAHAYAAAGLPASASAAMARALSAGYEPSTEDMDLHALAETDQHTAHALRAAAAPLLPIRRDDGRRVSMELDGCSLEEGAFNAHLADEVQGLAPQRLLRATLVRLVSSGATYVDLVPTDEATPLAVVTSVSTSSSYLVLRSDQSAVRRFREAATRHDVTMAGVVTSDPDALVSAIGSGTGPVVFHLRFRDAASVVHTSVLDAATRARRPLQIVWSDTDWPSLAHHPAFSAVALLAETHRLSTYAIGEHAGVVHRTSPDENPRAQLLHSC
jgi:hypothetical protein